ncbi:MAG: hypothetical protein KH072_12435, partial [Akkermansia sp.]
PAQAEEDGSGELSPVESYEELLSLRLRDVEQMADLIVSVQDRDRGEGVMEELGRLAERQKQYEVNCRQLLTLNPDIQELSREKHPVFHAILRERVVKAHSQVMEQLLRIHDVKYYGSAVIKDDLEKYGLKLTNKRMAQYLNSRMLPSMEAYLAQYSSMVDMLEGIDCKVAADAYAVSLALQCRMVQEQAVNVLRMEHTYQAWLPGFENYYHKGLAKLRVKADAECKRCFRALLKLATARMYDSPLLAKTVAGIWVDHPLMIDSPEFWNDPMMTMEEFCLSLERINLLLQDVKDPETADKRAIELVEVVSRLKRLRGHINRFQESGKMETVKANDLERVSRRAEDAEMTVSGAMARLIVETDVVTRSPLLSHALGFYRYVMYAR